MPNDPGVPSAPPSRGFASIVTLVSDVSKELLMVKGQLPGPLGLAPPDEPPTPQHATPLSSYQPAPPTPQRAPSRPQRAPSWPQRAPSWPQRVPQSVPQSHAISAARQKVNSPAVMLMVCAGLGICMDLAWIASEEGRDLIVLHLIQLAASSFTFFGALKMKNLESYGLARAASLVASIPSFTGCLVSVPVGIWSLVVLSKDDVKAAFR